MDIRFDTYYNNEQLHEILQYLTREHSPIMEYSSLGKSYEGRDIPLVTITNKKMGKDLEKPGLWIDANMHATEVVGTMAALYLICNIVNAYDKVSQITRIVDEQVVYIAPRINPDGAHAVFSSPPSFFRSGSRPYPMEDRQPGHHTQDVDEDGRILQMRFEDPCGDWKISQRDPRIMEKRAPYEENGTYYRLFPEGTIEDYDGHIIKDAVPLQGLDFNRNFPLGWRPEGEQVGAGDYPTSEPEVRCIADFFTQHRNVYAAISYHAFGRVILRPFSAKSDEEMNVDDKWVYDSIGEIGTQITQYPYVSIYHDFRYHPKTVLSGALTDWLYEHKGVFAIAIELWDLPTAAGVDKNEKKNFIQWFRKHPVEDDYKILDFINKNAPQGLQEWYEFEHPQLGKVELGGWDRLFTWRNPPKKLLENEIAPHADYAVALAAMAPRIAWREIEITPLGDNNYHLLVVIENQGYLPTYAAKQANKIKAVRPIKIELDLPANARLESGLRKQEIGHLEGRSNKQVLGYHATSPTDNRAKAEWLIYAPEPGMVRLHAICERGGTIHYEAPLQ